MFPIKPLLVKRVELLAPIYIPTDYERIQYKKRANCITLLKPSFPHFPQLNVHLDYNRLIAFLVPMVICQTIWSLLAFKYDFIELFRLNYKMMFAMILGSLFSGMTSEAGGAIAFPLMILWLRMHPILARDFSLMIQSVGMSTASATIFWIRLPLEWESIRWSFIGNTIGIIIGFEYIDPMLKNISKRMLFVSIWFSFALVLYVVNLDKDRRLNQEIPKFFPWYIRAIVLLTFGLIGGICGALTGSGADICAFAVMTLLFRVSERVATPSSVVIMAANACVGFAWKALVLKDISRFTWGLFFTNVPVVVLFAPLGAFLGSYLDRLVLSVFVYLLESAAWLGWLASSPSFKLVLSSFGIIFLSSLCFVAIGYTGKRLRNKNDKSVLKSLSHGKEISRIFDYSVQSIPITSSIPHRKNSLPLEETIQFATVRKNSLTPDSVAPDFKKVLP